MVHGNIKLSHSGAIIRYLGKMAGMNGIGKEYALSEMFIEETADLYSMLCTAHFKRDREIQLPKLLSDEGAFSKRLRYSETLLANGAYPSESLKNLTGAIYLVAVLDMARDLRPEVLNQFPHLLRLYSDIISSPAFEGITDWEVAFH